ncbi:MAG: hypothetical protein ACK4Y7_04205 [Caldimicrobium sp.]
MIKNKIYFIIFSIFLIFLSYTFSIAQTLEEAYDVNTEINLTGEIKDLVIPKRGMVYLEINKNDRVYRVFLCPHWYFNQIKPDFKIGDPVEIKGAKLFSKEFGLVVIAKSIKNLKTHKEILLRGNGCCTPIWKENKRRGYN